MNALQYQRTVARSLYTAIAALYSVNIIIINNAMIHDCVILIIKYAKWLYLYWRHRYVGMFLMIKNTILALKNEATLYRGVRENYAFLPSQYGI